MERIFRFEVDIIAMTEDVPHHTVTPIARKVDGRYELDIVLRDNHTTEQYPDGVFHPHQDVQHIKKENIEQSKWWDLW